MAPKGPAGCNVTVGITDAWGNRKHTEWAAADTGTDTGAEGVGGEGVHGGEIVRAGGAHDASACAAHAT